MPIAAPLAGTKPTADENMEPKPARTSLTRICRICSEEFLPMDGEETCSLLCRVQLWRTPGKLFSERKCGYCGDIPSTEDHVPPISARSMLVRTNEAHDYAFHSIPACRNCNCIILGRLAYWTFGERARYVATKLPASTGSIGWTRPEIAALGPNLRQFIQNAENQAIIAECRADHARRVVEELDAVGVEVGKLLMKLSEPRKEPVAALKKRRSRSGVRK